MVLFLRNNIEAVGTTLTNLKRSNMVFESKTILFLKAFRQIQFFVTCGTKDLNSASNFLKRLLSSYPKLSRLTTNMRQLTLLRNVDVDEVALLIPIFLLNV